MTRATTLLLALCFMGGLGLALAPSAGAAAECDFTGPPIGGIVGRTYQYAANVGDAACDETFSYAYDACVILLGSSKLCALA